LTAGLALICCAGTLLTGAALCARTGAVNMVTAMSAAATFVRACTHKIAIGDSDLIKVRFAPLCRLKSDILGGPKSAITGPLP
jgi:hypothetical protein